MMAEGDQLYFAAPEDLREWFEKNHTSEKVLLLGYYKTGSGKPSVTWPQSVDEALCFGWIDGVRKRIDDHRYFIRFTPRQPKSYWSRVNLKRFGELLAAGRVSPAGLAAYEARAGEANSLYSFEQQQPVVLPDEHERRFREREEAWAWLEKAAPSYRKAAIWWVISAKQQATKERRLQQLIDCSAQGTRVPPFTPRTGR